MVEETKTAPPDDGGVTVAELQSAIAAGVAEALKANAPAPPTPPAPDPVPAPAPDPKAQEEAVAKAVNEAMAAKEAEFQQKLDQQVAELRRVQVQEPTSSDIREEYLLRAPTDRPLMLGVAGKASDLLYLEMATRGLDSPKKSTLHNNKWFCKALDTATDGSGADYIPTGFSDQFVMDVNTALRLPAAFRRYTMAQESVTLPVEGSYPTVYLAGENTTPATRLTESSGTTANVTLKAIKLAALTIESFEYSQDALPVALQIIRNKLIVGLGRGIEDAIINGDTAASHMDADVTEAADRRKAWIGLRGKAMNDTTGNADIGTFNADTLMGLKKNMGEYGLDIANLVWVVSVSAWNQMLLLRDSDKNPVTLTVDKYGPQATVLTGELGKFLGIPVIPSPFMRETLNASGVYDGTTATKTGIMLVWRPAWVLGDRQEIVLETDRHAAGQFTDLVCTWRGDFKHALGTALTTVMGYNLTS
jgi:HK97 family phage major capsid protein